VGDQVGQAVEGTLYYIPNKEFERVRGYCWPKETRAAVFADMCRVNALYMIARAGSGHIGSSFSSMEIFSWLLLEELNIAPTLKDDGDLFFSSKGHDAPGYYAALMGLGRLDFDLIHKLRRIDGLPGHPDIATPGIVTNTGSLGMGVSKAKGMVFANRLAKRSGRVMVLTGDGELQEGQFWESLLSAANHRLHEITVIIDHNKLQSDTFVKNVSDLGDLEAKLRAFGWGVWRCNGNDTAALAVALKSMRDDPRPKVLIADTVKGKGVSFMEHTSMDSDVAMYRFHSGAPDADSYRRAAQEIIERLRFSMEKLESPSIEYETSVRDSSVAPSAAAQRLIPAYTKALLAQADKNPELVVLDADLVLDTGLIPFREKYPERFFECGIAEQDMVSIAGGMAIKGMLPIVHSFACFLSARPNEQIYNNATEHTKIIYVGSLAGVLPGGPGHSHQAVRDIASLSAIPDLVAIEPSCEEEVSPLLEWCVETGVGPCYLRINSLAWVVSYQHREMNMPVLGRGQVLKPGRGVAVITHGPAMLTSAFSAAEGVEREKGATVRIINLPWLNRIDDEWLKSALADCVHAVCLEDHYEVGGQADFIERALNLSGLNIQLTRIGLKGIPAGGTNVEVLANEGLDGPGVARVICSLISNRRLEK
jgi:transketolase